LDVTSARLIVRHRRQIERESESPSSEVVVIKDTNGNFPPGPKYDFTPTSTDNDSNVFDLDINENDGTFNFGGQLPHFHDFHHFHRSFGEIFDAIQRRFEEMTKNMMSFDNSFGPSFRPSTDIASIPDNTNNTVTEIVTFNGRRFLKKTTTIKKGGPGSALFIKSTTFEPVDDSENTDGNTDQESEAGSPPPAAKPTPDSALPVPGEPLQEQDSQQGADVKDVISASGSTPAVSSSNSSSLPSSPTPTSSLNPPSTPVDAREREEMTSPSPSSSSSSS